MFHEHLLLESKLPEGGNHGLFLFHFSAQYSSENSLPGNPWLDGLHRTCEIPKIVRKIIFACPVFYEEAPSFSLDSQRGQWLNG